MNQATARRALKDVSQIASIDTGMTLQVRVIAPDKTVWDAEAQEIILPSTTGQLGILGGHAPLLSALDTGVMRVRADQKWLSIVLMGGFAEIDNDQVTILVNGAETGEGIDLATAKSEYESAQTKTDAATTKQEKIQAKQALKRARARFQAAGGMS